MGIAFRLFNDARNRFSRRTLSTSAVVLTICTLALSYAHFATQTINEDSKAKTEVTTEEQDADVLGSRSPAIYITGSKTYGAGGLIALASTDEPSVEIGGYEVNGKATVSLYEADEQAVFIYLTHDKEGRQINSDIVLDSYRFIQDLEYDFSSSGSNRGKLLLPLQESGIYFLRLRKDDMTVDSVIIRSRVNAIVKEGDAEYIFWAQNHTTGRSINEGSLSLYNLQENPREIATASFNDMGIATTQLTADADIAFIRTGGEKAIVPINLRYLNTGYDYQPFQPKEIRARYFIFTDRPLYRPGDTIYFKSVIRNDDDARYTVPTGTAKIAIYEGYGNESPILEKNVPVSEDGTIHGEYTLSEKAKVGYYRLSVSLSENNSSYASFDVQYFRKPEYSIDVEIPSTDLVAGDASSFTINGTYFSGQPLIGQEVGYTIYAYDFYEYEYYTDRSYITDRSYNYGYYGGSVITSGTAVLDTKGQASVTLDTSGFITKGKSRMYSIEADFDDGSGNPTRSRKNVLVHQGEYDIYRNGYGYYSTKVNTQLLLPVKVVSHRSGSVADIRLTANIRRENWVPYQEEGKKYPSYRKESETLEPIFATTDKDGNATFSLIAKNVGSYQFIVEGKDARGNTVSKPFSSYVTSEDIPMYFGEMGNDLTLQPDKAVYLPTDTARITITSTIPDRDIFLSLERGRVNRFRVVQMTGRITSVDIPLVDTDMPNIFVDASSFSSEWLDNGSTDLQVSANTKKLIVNITPDKTSYGPGESTTLNIETKTISGEPVTADIAVWAVDKAIFELSDDFDKSIFDTFWSHRYNDTQDAHSLEGIIVNMAEKGGCFTEGTKVLMANGTSKPIETIKKDDYILTRAGPMDTRLVRAKVTGTHTAVAESIVIINGTLQVTSNHKLWVNAVWKEAGSIGIGDFLTGQDGNVREVTSVEFVSGRFRVHNLTIEDKETYFAGGIWVHNDKGEARTVFKDTAYWNPSVRTDLNGRAKISFTLPDNLTTWVISGIAANRETKVGQTTAEVTVTKDVIVRPILPNILRVGDAPVLSALVQNFTENNHIFNVDLTFDAGVIKSATHTAIPIASKDMQQLSWEVSPDFENDAATLTFSAWNPQQDDTSDTIAKKIPIRPFGFFEQTVKTADGPMEIPIKLAEDAHSDRSIISLSLAPTILGTLPSAMKYLIGYPYGCIEQTTSKFVPVVIAKANPDLFGKILDDADLDAMIEKGLDRLAIHQQSDGGWAWWYSGASNPFISAYVIEYILLAKQTGVSIDEDMLSRAERYLAYEKAYDPEVNQHWSLNKQDAIAKTYAKTLIGNSQGSKLISDFVGLSPDIISLAVMANYRNGFKDPETNGLATLMKMAKPQGDSVYWEKGDSKNFGSIDASTALAIRAITLADGDRELAVKGARYLTRNRKNSYWSNTFATAQVIRAVTDLARTGSELTPDYRYTVSLDGKEISRGNITSATQVIQDISIPVRQIQSKGSTVSISKTGDGQLYSTLITDQFHTDRNAKAVSKGLSIKREYINNKGEEYSIAIGDSVTVMITVSGLETNEYYGVITDELPAGLIPVNQTLDNERRDIRNYYSSYDVTDRDITENGIVLSLYQMSKGERKYTYKARAVTAGVFSIPPATASLMYAPEVYGRSDTGTLRITNESTIIPGKAITQAVKNTAISPAFLAKIALYGGSILLAAVGITIALVKNHGFRSKIRSILINVRYNAQHIYKIFAKKHDEKDASDSGQT